MTDLHTTVTHRLSELRAVAQAAAEASRSPKWWNTADPIGYHVEPVDHDPDRLGRVVLRAGEDMGATGDESAALATHIATWNPAHSLRWIEWAEEVLREHSFSVTSSGPWCDFCNEGYGVDWPCDHIHGLCRALDIEVSG